MMNSLIARSLQPKPENLAFKLALCALLVLVASFSSGGCAGVVDSAPKAQPAISVTPASISFSNVVSGQKSSQTVQISNTGDATLEVSGISISGTGFSLGSVTVPFQIAASKSSSFTITFTAGSSATVNGTLSITSNAPAAVLNVPVQASTLASSAAWQITPATANFASVTVGSKASVNGTLKNSGNVALTVSSLAISNNLFTIGGLASGTKLTPGQTVNFTLNFNPTATGTSTGTVKLVSNPVSTTAQINLTGTGVAAPTPPPSKHTVSLSWTPSTSSVIGYRIYRSTTTGGPYSTVNAGVTTSASFVDSAVASGTTYFYVTTAIDAFGTESSFSNEAVAVVPNP